MNPDELTPAFWVPVAIIAWTLLLAPKIRAYRKNRR